MKTNIPTAVLVLAVALCGWVHGQGQTSSPPELTVNGVPSPRDTNANLVLKATPGLYTIETCPNLTTSWIEEANVSVGAGGLVDLTIPFSGRSPLFIRARGRASTNEPDYSVRFQTLGTSFEPELATESGSSEGIRWTWSDGTTSSSYPLALKEFGSPGSREQCLLARPPTVLTAINIGFDGVDGGGATPLSLRAPQNVSAVYFAQPLTSLRSWGCSYNPITNMLDFRGFTNLQYIECYGCASLSQIAVTDLPALKRLCMEEGNLRELDLSGDPALEDLRAAENGLTNVVVGRGTGPRVQHWCTRDNPGLTRQWQDLMTNFYSLREVLIWNNNQSGHLRFVSTRIEDFHAHKNQLSSIDLAGQSNLWRCLVYNNQLTNLDLSGCVALQELDAHGNRLTTAALDNLLGLLDSSAPNLRSLDLSRNAELPSPIGYGHYTNLVNRNVAVLLNWPDSNDGRIDVVGGSNAITFVTTGQNPNMEIRIAGAVPTRLRWHWGDGTLTEGALLASHDFGVAVPHTNYVEVLPAECVIYFGARQGFTDQGITGVFGLANFPNVSFLYLYHESLTDLSLAGCSNLRQLHLGENPVSVSVCDQWFVDLDQAVTGPVRGADLIYDGGKRSSNSDAAWASLVSKGFVMWAK